MGVHGYCLPIKTIVNDELVDTATLCAPSSSPSSSSSSSSYASLPLNEVPLIAEYQRGEEVVRDKGKEATGGPRSKHDSKLQDIRDRLAQLPGSDLPGFIPLREDFDVEHENDAEHLLADMEFSPDDHPSERALKLQVISIYNKKLDERNRRKRFAIDRGMIDFKKQQQIDRRRSKEERELVARLRMFARFHTAQEHEALVDGILKARRLRQQIELYQHYRRMGVRTLEQARQYEADRKKRESELKARKHREGAPYLFETGRRNGSTSSLSQGDPSATTSGRRGRRDAAADDAEEADADTGNFSSSLEGGGAGQGRGRGASKRGLTAADLGKAPGAELLSEKELELCAQVPLLPTHYLAAKDAIVR